MPLSFLTFHSSATGLPRDFSLKLKIQSDIFRFDALDTLGNIISELKANDKTKTELKEKLTVTVHTTLK